MGPASVQWPCSSVSSAVSGNFEASGICQPSRLSHNRYIVNLVSRARIAQNFRTTTESGPSIGGGDLVFADEIGCLSAIAKNVAREIHYVICAGLTHIVPIFW